MPRLRVASCSSSGVSGPSVGGGLDTRQWYPGAPGTPSGSAHRPVFVTAHNQAAPPGMSAALIGSMKAIIGLVLALGLASTSACVATVRPARTAVVVERTPPLCPEGFHWDGRECIRRVHYWR